MAVIPSWLEAPDTAGEYLKGVQIGSGIAGERARLEQEQSRAAMEHELRTQQMQKDAQLQSAQLQTTKAYREAQLGLRKQQLDEAAKMNAQRTQAAATRLKQQIAAQEMRAQHPEMPESEVLWRSGAGTPVNIHEAKAAEETAKYHADELALRKQTEDRLAMANAQKPLTGTYNLPADDKGQSAGSVRGPLSGLQERFGTNLPPQMQLPKAQPKPAVKYQTAKDVQAAYRGGELSRAEASKMLTEQFSFKPKPQEE